MHTPRVLAEGKVLIKLGGAQEESVTHIGMIQDFGHATLSQCDTSRHNSLVSNLVIVTFDPDAHRVAHPSQATAHTRRCTVTTH